MPHQDQPVAKLTLGEYELQVFETIAQHAIEQGAVKPELLAIADGLLQKARAGRADLVLLRRRKAARDAGRASRSPDPE